MIALILAIVWIEWVATVAVPLMIVCIPLLWAHINSKLNKLDSRNTTQHSSAQELRKERFDALEARLDEVLKLAADTNEAVHDTNTKIDTHLRDHLMGVA